MSAGSGGTELRTCSVATLDVGLCGTVRVAEDPSRRQGRQIDLRVRILPARTGRVEADPVFLLTGGPGTAAPDLADYAKRILSQAD